MLPLHHPAMFIAGRPALFHNVRHPALSLRSVNICTPLFLFLANSMFNITKHKRRKTFYFYINSMSDFVKNKTSFYYYMLINKGFSRLRTNKKSHFLRNFNCITFTVCIVFLNFFCQLLFCLVKFLF